MFISNITKKHNLLARVIVFALIVTVLSGCKNNETNRENCEEIIITKRIINLAGGERDFRDFIEENDDGNYVEIVNNDDETISIFLEKGQKDKLINSVDDKINDLIIDFKSINTKYELIISEDYKNIELYYNTSLGFRESFEIISRCMFYCSLQQLYMNDNSDCIINIYNCDTSKLLVDGRMDDSISYDMEDWEKSYSLDNSEIESLVKNSNAIEYKISTDFADAMDMIYFYINAVGLQFEYIYIDNNSNLVLGINEISRQEYVDLIDQYLCDIGISYGVGSNDNNIEADDSISRVKIFVNGDDHNTNTYLLRVESALTLKKVISQDRKKYKIAFEVIEKDTNELISKTITKMGDV